MQMYRNSNQKSNIFKDIADLRTKRSRQVTEAEVKTAEHTRSDKTNADEAKFWLNIVLIVMTIITAGLATMFYQDSFNASVGLLASWILAMALAFAVEIGKIKLMLRALRSALFGWMFSSWSNLGFWGFVWVLGLSFFAWSVRISTKGLAIYSQNMAETKIEKDSLAPRLAAATADIDRQIESETAARTDAQNNKWRGTTVFVSSKQAKANTANIAALQAQRKQIVDQTIEDYKADVAKRGNKISGFSLFIKEYGGYAEYISFMCIIAIGFFNRRLVDVVIESQEHAPTQQVPQQGQNIQTPPPPQAHPQTNGHTFYNRQSDGNVRPAQHSSTVLYNVPQITKQQPAIGADAIIRTAKTAITSDLSNLTNGNGMPRTVAGRIYRAIEDVGRGLQSTGFNPSPEKATEFYEFMVSRAFPLLEEHNRPYEYKTAFLSDLEKHVDQKLLAEMTA